MGESTNASNNGEGANVKSDVPTSGSNDRHNNNNDKKRGASKKPASTKTPKFTGRQEGLEDYVYEKRGSKQQHAEAYTKMTLEIATYVGKHSFTIATGVGTFTHRF